MLNWFCRHAPVSFKLGFALVVCCAPLPLSFCLALSDSSRFASAATHGVFGEMQNLMMTAGDANMIFCAVFGPVCIVTALLVYGTVAPPHRTLVDSAEAVAGGDFSAPVPLRDRSDCIGRLARALETCRRNARTTQEDCDRYRAIIARLSRGCDIDAVPAPSFARSIEAIDFIPAHESAPVPGFAQAPTPSADNPPPGSLRADAQLRELLDRLSRHRDLERSR